MVALVLGAVAVVIIIVAIAVLKPQIGAGPVIKPRPFSPPGGIPKGFKGTLPNGAPTQPPPNGG